MATIDDGPMQWPSFHYYQAAFSSVESTVAKLVRGLEYVIKEPKYLDIK